MSRSRSAEYSKLCLDIFLLSNEELHEQLERCELIISDSNATYIADVTYGEWEFLLLTELEFRQTVGMHGSCVTCESAIERLLQEQS